MRKKRVSMPKIKTSSKAVKAEKTEKSSTPEFKRFIGISIAGGKSDKACLAVVDYYPEQKKIFLTRLFEKIKSDHVVSGDLKIHHLIQEHNDHIEYVAFDAPLNLPECLICQEHKKRVCPGYESCKEPHITWMWTNYKKFSEKKKPKKLFTPYTQRCVELYFQNELKEKFPLHHAMGANAAPLLARAFFIKHRLKVNTIEVYPKLSFWRMGEKLKLMTSDLKSHRAAFGGDESREKFIQELSRNDWAFIYHQDAKSMIENSHAFEAFICALTAYLKYQKQTESKPKGFPEDEAWIEFPKGNFSF